MRRPALQDDKSFYWQPLEQRRRSTLPGFAFFLGNVLHVVHVGAGLRQDVMQIVADADERETLLQELAHARGAEEEQSEDHVVLLRVIDQLLRGRAQFRRRVHVGELVLFVETHRHAEVVLPEEQNVDAGNGGDLGNVLDA